MTPISSVAYGLSVSLTIVVIILMGIFEDWWGIAVIGLLVLTRLCNTIVIRRRSKPGWSGAPEPGRNGDLLVLLSQDRWIRIQGTVDDLKLVTSGQWLRDETIAESWATALATVIVYLDAALVTNLKQSGQILLLVLLIASAGLLAIVNGTTKDLQMHGKIVSVLGKPKPYNRRQELADELIKETGRDDWAVRLGMIVKNGCQCNDAMRVTM
ncbi:hypothetical protein F5B22DRAFT_661635 [Xylaria bambusicola]|uniref:uncharacterized protein n=1 Tax=Xylaria bambusicola TaxID=326684 RepID=UPI002007DA4D|nr:uncharacterized protein F5B22DRAFT_661635 [Xylaria bambusicola]KAI0505323.1 hypothetical protein F5B22DRAFT_661635 [Xylaria bambusicola]